MNEWPSRSRDTSSALKGKLETEEEVSAEPQRIDITFAPDTGSIRRGTDLLRRMTERRCMLEPFSSTPGVEQVRDTLRKQLTWEHVLALRERRAQRAPGWAWIISPGRPTSALEAFRFRKMGGWPEGFYAVPGQWNLAVVVLLELPPGRDTLTLRLMGSGKVLKRATEELFALPPGEREPEIEDVIIRIHKEMLETMRNRPLTEQEEDFFEATRDVVEKWAQELRDEGHREGEDKARREYAFQLQRNLKHLYENRFGECPLDLAERLDATAIDRLVELISVFAMGTPDEIRRALDRSRA
jgi:hypothetical protein